MKKRSYFLTFLICFSQISYLLAQTNYQKGWDYLNKADYDNGVSYFEKALKDKASKEKAQLTLTMLYSVVGKQEKASELFNDFYNNNPDPSAELFALWFEEGVISPPKKHTNYQFNLLKKIEADNRIKSKFEEIIKYRLINHYTFSFDTTKVAEYDAKSTSIKKWALVGPFDNVMNSGFNKDFGVLADPQMNKSFQSRYGSPIQWFIPLECTNSGYFFRDYNFFSSNSIVYTQSFVESPEEKDVILKLGYSGSLKVWLNDDLAFTESEKRRTEIDYFQVKCHLNKGFNRIVVQLGDYEESYPSLFVRFTDLNHAPLVLSNTNQYQAYQKNKGTFTQLPFFAVEGIKNKLKATPDDILYNLLLARTYLRANDLYAAEEILAKLYETYPKNYLVLRALIGFYKISDNTTEQNKTYEIFKELYPQDFEILSNQIKEATDQKDKTKALKAIEAFKNKYPYATLNIDLTDIILLAFEENVDKIVAKVDEIHKKYPSQEHVLIAKYQIQKALINNPKESNAILENYLKENYNFQILETLISDYVSQGRIDDGIQLFEKAQKVAKDQIIEKKIVNLYSRKRDYDKAIEICKKVLANRPSDYETLSDLATLYKMKNDKTKAIDYYEQALRYFPFSFEFNEKIRELKSLKPSLEVIETTTAAEDITAYEKEFVAKNKKPYDIISDKKTLIIFKTKATGYKRSYVIRINQESAIEDWQKITLNASNNMQIQVNEVKTIKKNGNKIDAERNGNEAVFTNLEVGDYIYVDYNEKQTSGSKSTLFVYDIFALNSFTPTFRREYNILIEDGLTLTDTIINSIAKPAITSLQGFKKYSWNLTAPDVIKEESYTPPFNDIASVVHTSLGYKWFDIAQWYSDLSEQQIQPDFTIQTIVKQLFDGKNYTEEQKAKIIYDFVCKNIQYSSIDFRQGSYIPQKASDVYHTRLGDCKDVSTLYASIARAAGLNVNLVLINTRDNGQKDVILPSLNFNHCIVKVNLKNGSKYLELTDTDLPYGYLSYYHNEASILEIPAKNIPKDIKLTSLQLNKGYENKIFRNTMLKVNTNNSIELTVKSTKTGVAASNSCKVYYNSDDAKRKEDLKKDLSNSFTSTLKINSFVFDKLEPRADSSVYSYSFSVENEVKKVGTFRTLKIPFNDVIAKLNIFDDGQRVFDFDYNYYEPFDYYDESFIVSLDSPLKIMEVPEDVHLSFNGNRYDLSFTKVDDQHLKINRKYKVERRNIQPKEFEDFKAFITKVVEADNTSLVFK